MEESSVVLFDAEDLAFIVAGKSGRIEDDDVELTSLFGEAAEPVKGIAFAEVVIFGRDVVKAEIFAGPIEIDLGEVEGGGDGSGGSGSDGEEAGVGEGVEDGLSGFDEGAKGGTVVALIDEDALGVA